MEIKVTVSLCLLNVVELEILLYGKNYRSVTGNFKFINFSGI